MSFFIAYFIIALACCAITIKNLVGYGEVNRWIKIAVSALIIIGWFGAAPLEFIKRHNILTDVTYGTISTVLYAMLAFVFILFVCLMLRDIIWFVIFRILKLSGHASWEWDPNNETMLARANIVVAILTLVVCIYAAYQATKQPMVVELNVTSDKITGNLKIVQLSDLHLSRNSSVEHTRELVGKVNGLTPDIIVLTGDIIDDDINKIKPLLKELRELSAPYGIYSAMGNKEFSNNIYEAKKALDEHGIPLLFNGGTEIKMANVFIGAVPDYNTMSERINLWRTIYKTKKGTYRVLLSHSPMIVDALSKDVFDMVLSGHTLGGQFFPFHWFVEKANHYLGGHYNVNGIDLFVSRGVSTYGPKMRLFAPADIAVINLRTK